MKRFGILLLTLVLGAGFAQQNKMTPELQEETARAIREQSNFTVKEIHEAELIRMISLTKTEIFGVSDSLTTPVAQALVNQTPKRVKVTVATGKTNYSKNPIFKQLSKYGVHTVVLSKPTFNTDILILDNNAAVYVVGKKVTVIKGSYVKTIRQILEDTIKKTK